MAATGQSLLQRTVSKEDLLVDVKGKKGQAGITLIVAEALNADLGSLPHEILAKAFGYMADSAGPWPLSALKDRSDVENSVNRPEREPWDKSRAIPVSSKRIRCVIYEGLHDCADDLRHHLAVCIQARTKHESSLLFILIATPDQSGSLKYLNLLPRELYYLPTHVLILDDLTVPLRAGESPFGYRMVGGQMEFLWYGTKLSPLSDTKRKTVEVLVNGSPRKLSLKVLIEISKVPSPHRALEELIKTEPWEQIISFPRAGKGRGRPSGGTGGYGLLLDPVKWP